jgi:hypothetical protein
VTNVPTLRRQYGRVNESARFVSRALPCQHGFVAEEKCRRERFRAAAPM